MKRLLDQQLAHRSSTGKECRSGCSRYATTCILPYADVVWRWWIGEATASPTEPISTIPRTHSKFRNPRANLVGSRKTINKSLLVKALPRAGIDRREIFRQASPHLVLQAFPGIYWVDGKLIIKMKRFAHEDSTMMTAPFGHLLFMCFLRMSFLLNSALHSLHSYGLI